MAEDVQVLREVWHSSLPIVFRLADNELTSLSTPDPYYAMVSRLHYLPLVMDKVVQHFQRFVKEDQRSAKDLWLDFEGTPLKWHYPVGLLVDIHAPQSLPFALTVHFQDLPEDHVVRCCSRAAIEALFISSVKEADSLKHAPQKVMASLQKKDHVQLWTGVCEDKFDQFWAVNRKLMEQDFRFVPFRLYSDGQVIQRLVKAKREDGQWTRFGDLLDQVLPEEERHQKRWLVQGVEPPTDTPLQWLSRHLSHCDNFVHIVGVDH